MIGRAFLYEILLEISGFKERIDSGLSMLEKLDLIRTRSFEPELEYIFKHALTQEVVYTGLLKKERQEIHERIGMTIEKLFNDRLPEFYETLAFHYSNGQFIFKAVDYLMKSGEKSLRRYAVEDAHQYYQKAFEILRNKPDRTKEEDQLLIDLLMRWSLVFYYRGDFRMLTDLLIGYESLTESLGDKARRGMFYAWIGFTLQNRCRIKESHHYLLKALKLGKEIENDSIIGYACTWLTWTCTDLGLLDDAVAYGKKAQEISKSLKVDHYLYFKSLTGMGFAYFFKGDSKKAIEVGKQLLDYGYKHSNIRSQSMGSYVMGYGYCAGGDFSTATKICETAVQTTTDPFYSQVLKGLLGYSYLQNGQFKEAKNTLEEFVSYGQEFGFEAGEKIARALLSVILIAEGQMSQGLRNLKEAQNEYYETQSKCYSVAIENLLGKIYLEIVKGPKPSFLNMSKNIGFLLKNAPLASRKAEDHFEKTIEAAKEIGLKGILGQAYLDLGLLHKTKRKTDLARKYISQAVDVFEDCDAECFLKLAKDALASLG